MVEEKIGVVEHFFTNINVAAIRITDGELKVGDTIHVVVRILILSKKLKPWRSTVTLFKWLNRVTMLGLRLKTGLESTMLYIRFQRNKI